MKDAIRKWVGSAAVRRWRHRRARAGGGPFRRDGDCITGCNQGAKKTLDTNDLARARRAGAELFCGGWVEAPQRDASDTHWVVDWHLTRTELRPPGDRPFRLRAGQVVLAAGSLCPV